MTPQFQSPLRFEDRGGFPLILLEPLVYLSAVLDRPVHVPAGFPTDLASIPRLLWNILPPIGKYDAAAVVHDFLYQTNGVTRGQADAVLREAMQVCGVGWWTRAVIWSGVRIGGWRPWQAYRAKELV